MESNLNKLNQLVTHSILWFGAYLNLVTQGKSSSRFASSGCFIKNMIHCEPVFWQNPTNGTFIYIVPININEMQVTQCHFSIHACFTGSVILPRLNQRPPKLEKNHRTVTLGWSGNLPPSLTFTIRQERFFSKNNHNNRPKLSEFYASLFCEQKIWTACTWTIGEILVFFCQMTLYNISTRWFKVTFSSPI